MRRGLSAVLALLLALLLALGALSIPALAEEDADLTPPISGEETDALPPIVSGGEADALPPVSSGGETDALPPISGGDADTLPPVSGGDADALPPISGGVPPVVTPPTESQPEQYEGWEVSYSVPDGFTGFFDMPLGDTAFFQLHSYLDSVAIYATAEKDGQTSGLKLSISWDFSTVDAGTPGTYSAVGTIVLPDGAIRAAGATETVTIAVIVTAPVSVPPLPPAIVLTGFAQLPAAGAVAIAANDESGLNRWFSDERLVVTAYDADGGSCKLFADQWDLSAVDTTVPGVYAATVRPTLESGYALADGVTLPVWTCWVSVQTAGEPEIDCYTAARGFFVFPWVLSAAQEAQLDAFSVWLRPSGGDWAQLTGTAAQLTVHDLQLSAGALTKGAGYELQVDYPGGHTGILSFIFDETLLISDYSEGSRDGGGDGVQLPDVIQPAPDGGGSGGNHSDGNSDGDSGGAADAPAEPPAVSEIPIAPETVPTVEPQQEDSPPLPAPEGPVPDAAASAETEKPSPAGDAPAPLLEWETADGVVLSAARVLALVKLGEPLAMQKGDAAVTLSAATLQALGLSGEQALTLTLTMSSPRTVSLAASVDGTAVEHLTAARLRVQYTPVLENAAFWILDESGARLTRADYADGTLSFAVNRSGTYTISEEAAEPSAAAETSAVLPEAKPSAPPVRRPAAAGLVLLALASLAGLLVWHRRRMG